MVEVVELWLSVVGVRGRVGKVGRRCRGVALDVDFVGR